MKRGSFMSAPLWGGILAVLLLAVPGCAGTRPPAPETVSADRARVGYASYYAAAHHGRRTASGEVFDMHAMTAAHRSLAFGTRVRVTNLANGRCAIVRINDRGPFARNRILDVSYAAAVELGIRRRGIGRVRLEVLDRPAVPRSRRGLPQDPPSAVR